MQTNLRAAFAACGVVLATAFTSVATAQPTGNDSELVGMLSKELGVTPDQARGGAGALFSQAKLKMAPDDFARVGNAVPGMDGLLKAAPAADAAGGALSQLGAVAGVAGAFKKLGLSPAMAAKFVPLLTKFVGGKGGPEVAKLLAGVLK